MPQAIFGGFGDPEVDTLKGVIDLPATNWEVTKAKLKCIEEVIIDDLGGHTRAGSYAVVTSKSRAGYVRLVWHHHEDASHVPTIEEMERHAAAFLRLYNKQHYRAKMRKLLPEMEARVAAGDARVELLCKQAPGEYATGERFALSDLET